MPKQLLPEGMHEQRYQTLKTLSKRIHQGCVRCGPAGALKPDLPLSLQPAPGSCCAVSQPRRRRLDRLPMHARQNSRTLALRLDPSPGRLPWSQLGQLSGPEAHAVSTVSAAELNFIYSIWKIKRITKTNKYVE